MSNNPNTLSPLQAVSPQYVSGKKQPVYTHDQARQIIENRPLPPNIYRPAQPTTGSIHAFAAGQATNMAQGADSIVEQARALKNDIDLIHEFVHGNIEFHSTTGLHKGAYGALLDGIGNAWDQADLMVQLLRQAGYEANYLFGELDLSQSDATAWLGTTDIFVARDRLLDGGNSTATVVWNGSENRLQFSHVWVKAKIGSTWYQFDPVVFKTYSTKSGINLATAMGYNATTFMNNARSGATVHADYVQNMNRTNIRNDLATMTANLVTYIKTNNHAWSVDDVLGGRSINPLTPGVRQTTHPKLKSGTTPTEWTAIPDSYKHTLNVYFDNGTIDVSFFSSDIYGKRLTFFYNASHQAELRLEGTLLDTSSAQTVGGWNSVKLTITHPYGSTWADQFAWLRVWTDKYYIIANAWGTCGRQMTEVHRKKLTENRLAGLADTHESVLGESFETMWFHHYAANTRVIDLINRITNCVTVLHHQAGLVGYYDTPLMDIALATHSSTALDGTTNREIWNDAAGGLHGVSFEASTVQQTSDITGVSTTPVVDKAASIGNKVYDAKSANWSTVRPALINYTTQTLDDIENWYINNGFRVVIPENASQTVDQWQGYGYYGYKSAGGAPFGTIGGGLKGVSGGQPITIPNDNDQKEKQVPKPQNKKGPPPGVAGGPVDVLRGNETAWFEDITVGSGDYPYRLNFSRAYNSGNRLENGPLGFGWTHNLAMTAKVNSDALLGLADYLPIAGATGIVEVFVCCDLLSDLSRPHDKFVTCALANQWLNEQLWKNTVVVTTQEGIQVFTKLPDGSFVAPPASSWTLVKNGDGTFTVKNPQQIALNFNTSGDIGTIVYPAGVTITFSYTSGKLTSVSNGLTRTLTLSYTGNYLSSVSDGTGGSVTFSVNGTTKNLDSVTDPDSKTVSLAYDLPGRLTQIKAPANPTIAVFSMVYDSLDRVKEQRDAFNNLWQFFLAGSRSEVVDPNNNKRIYYFNRLGSIVRDIDEVGKETKHEFDGLNRKTKTIFPEGNELRWTFDVKNNVLSERRVAKSGSGLADIVNSWTYHTTFNKPITHTDGRSNQTTFSIDATTGNLLTIQRPQIGGQTPTVTFTWNSRGQILTRTDETSIVTKWNYDTTTEKLTSVVVDQGTGRLNLTTSFGHNSRGDVTSVTDPRGKQTVYDWDVKRRPTQKTDPSPLSYVTKWSFDANDNLWKIERQTGDAANPWQTFTATFDYMDQLKTVTDPQNGVTAWDYDSLRRLWKLTDAENRVWEHAYDAASRLYTVKDPALNIVETRLYSNNGKLASIKDARNNTTTYSRDGHDRLDRATYADSTYEQNQSYDANDNILIYRTRSGNTVTRTFDVLNREATRAPQGQATVTLTYDLAGRLTKASKPVVSGDPSTGDFQFFFDTAGRFWKEQYPDGKVIQHVLDANGNQTKTTWPDSYFVDRTWDELNRLIDIKLNGSGTAAAHFDWDALSRRKKLTYQNGVVCDYSYQLDDDLASIVHTFVGSGVTLTPGYDKTHKLIGQVVSDPNYLWSPPATVSTTYGTADSVNKYPTVGGASYSYNGNACLTGDGTWTFGYDTENHLLTASKTGVSVTNLYDPVHRQREHQVGSTKNRYVYAGWQRIADYDGATDTLQNRYVYGTDLDHILIKVSSGGTLTYHSHNHQGSVIALSNSSGAVTNTYKYSPFGVSPSLTSTTHGYTGQRFESESGLYYYKARYYLPSIGRFLQPDPIGYYGGDLNLYTYVKNDPLNFVDPEGLFGKPPIPPILPPFFPPGVIPNAGGGGTPPPPPPPPPPQGPYSPITPGIPGPAAGPGNPNDQPDPNKGPKPGGWKTGQPGDPAGPSPGGSENPLHDNIVDFGANEGLIDSLNNLFYGW